jgi:hypothetical protein
VVADYWAAMAEHDVADELGAVTAPTTCLGATDDVSVPVAAMKAVADRIPLAWFREIPGPHIAVLEEPAAFATPSPSTCGGSTRCSVWGRDPVERDPVGKALAVLSALADEPDGPWSVRGLARDLDTSPATVHRIFTTFEARRPARPRRRGRLPGRARALPPLRGAARQLRAGRARPSAHPGASRRSPARPCCSGRTSPPVRR